MTNPIPVHQDTACTVFSLIADVAKSRTVQQIRLLSHKRTNNTDSFSLWYWYPTHYS